MEKDEILRKAQSVRENQPDEMEKQVVQAGSEFSMSVGLVLCIVLMAVKQYKDLPWGDLYGLFGTMVGVFHLYKWRKLGTRQSLVVGAMWLLAGVIMLVSYLTKIL